MLNYIENLRKKPESEKKKKTFLISFVITLMIAIVWAIYTFMWQPIQNASQNDSRVSNIPSLKETFSSFFDQIGNIFKNTESIENPPGTTNVEVIDPGTQDQTPETYPPATQETQYDPSSYSEQ